MFYVGLSLLIVKLSARNACGHSLVPVLWWAYTDISLLRASIIAGPILELYYDYKMHLCHKGQETLIRQVLLLRTPGGYTTHLGPHNRIMGREVEWGQGERWEHGPEVLPLLVFGKGCLRFCEFMLREFKTWVRIKAQEGKSKRSISQLSKSTGPLSKKRGTSLWCWGVAWLII